MSNSMEIVYLSGKITENDNYINDFALAEQFLEKKGYCVLNPCRIGEVSSKELTHEQYMKICYTLIDVCDFIFMLSCWQKSKGANAELTYAKSLGKKVMYQDYYAPFRKGSENEESTEETVR